MDRGMVVRPSTEYWWAEIIKLVLQLAIVGLLIGILVCVCQTKNVTEDIHSVVKLLKQLGPCLVDEFCPPPV